jgi:DNA-binding NarL/FixJ family response regulator
MIRIILVEDHATLREALVVLLERESDMMVVGEAGSVGEARWLLATKVSADVAVVDLTLPDGEGVEVIEEYLGSGAINSVLAITALSETHDRARAVAAGALGVLHKSAPTADIIASIRRLHRGEALLTPSQIIELLRLVGDHREKERNAQSALNQLTPREVEVIQVLAEGLSDKEVADRLCIASKTVRIHVANILGKLGLESRLQVVLFAARHGLVNVREPQTYVARAGVPSRAPDRPERVAHF